jgi:hypothetical protein
MVGVMAGVMAGVMESVMEWNNKQPIKQNSE